MLSDSISWVLKDPGCVALEDIVLALSPPTVSKGASREMIEAALLALPIFARCAEMANRWSLAGHCRHSSQPDFDPTVGTEVIMGQPYSWQEEALLAWENAGRRGMIQAVTGAGKSMVAMLAMERILVKDAHVMVIVPTLELQTQWFTQLNAVFGRKFSVARYSRNKVPRFFSEPQILIAVVNSVRSFSTALKGRGDLLVADEVHRYATGCNSNALGNEYDFRLGLSATIDRRDGADKRYLFPYFGSIIFTYTHISARRDGVIAPFMLTLWAVRMSSGERASYEDLTEQIRTLFRHFMALYKLPLTQESFIEVLSKACAGHLAFISPDLEDVGKRLQAALMLRRATLDALESKVDELKPLLPDISGARRSIIFTQSIASAKMVEAFLLQYGVRAAAIHSQTPMQVRREHLHRFRQGQLDVIVAPRILDEGIDVPEADLAIIMTASGSERQLVQRLGRVLRRKADGEYAHLVILFAADTVEDPDNGAHESVLPHLIAAAESVRKVAGGKNADVVDGHW